MTLKCELKKLLPPLAAPRSLVVGIISFSLDKLLLFTLIAVHPQKVVFSFWNLFQGNIKDVETRHVILGSAVLVLCLDLLFSFLLVVASALRRRPVLLLWWCLCLPHLILRAGAIVTLAMSTSAVVAVKIVQILEPEELEKDDKTEIHWQTLNFLLLIGAFYTYQFILVLGDTLRAKRYVLANAVAQTDRAGLCKVSADVEDPLTEEYEDVSLLDEHTENDIEMETKNS